MTALPVSCDHCGWTGLVDGLVGFDPRSTATVFLQGNLVSCPNRDCGFEARIIDGRVFVRSGLIHVFTDEALPPASWPVLAAAAEQAELVAETDPDEAISLVSRVSNTAGGFLRALQDMDESREMMGFKTGLKYLRNVAAAGFGGAVAYPEIVRIVDSVLK